ncbi:unnamed protein product [Peronospora belbahrii]|uniref:Uncharacterized protein n=1 Tax=Peronospora belbahrii TaxID=622444 RepID=A0AAU9KM47_9STRA|nr:unnamed protein product [Peronospora belbahrii]CAH0517570.1 unnamed protein product [Peronospora belbahrii]
MWMQKSVEGSSFSSSSGHLHDRNRFNSHYAQGGSSHGHAASIDTSDWKSKILESGQWLGGKVIEYGGKLARGPTTDSIPDHYAHQMPRNDGRANWMADIRSSSSSLQARGSSSSGGFTGGYQNDFVTERPKAYSDFSKGCSNNSLAGKGYEGYDRGESSRDSSNDTKNRHAKKKKEGKKSMTKSKKKAKQKKQQSDSDNEVESKKEEMSVSESSETESMDERRHKSKVKAKKKSKNVKKRSKFYSEESESDHEHDKRKASTSYAFSFDPAKLPPSPAEDQERVINKKIKVKKSKKDKVCKKLHSRRAPIASLDDELTSEKERLHTAKKRSSKTLGATASSASVDLLGVDLDELPLAQPLDSGRSTQAVQPSVFDTPQSQNPLQDLAGLSFTGPVQDPVQDPAPTQSPAFDGNAVAAASNEAMKPLHSQSNDFLTKLLPENNIVDLSSLVSDKKKLSANPDAKRTLNEMQKASGSNQPKPVMAMPMQGQQQPNTPGSMMQLNMNQLQITDGATGMQQRMYSKMQMHQMPMQAQPQMLMMQPQMAMMTHSQMLNDQMMHMQPFAQGGATTAQPPEAANCTRSDSFHQLP